MDKQQKLIIKEVKIGKGVEVEEGDHVTIHYTGWLEETPGSGKPGKKFDSSIDRDQPFQTPIGVGYVIKGWDEGVIGMKVGGKRRLIIPHELGYGSYGVEPDIPGFATLIFDVELLDSE
jgi:FKBP-type peptidyl-prolyl cis-trans isomerase FkpA